MAHATTLPVMAGLSLVGAALGVHLGQSTVAEINPAHFGDPETYFHTDLVPHRSGGEWAQVQAAEYQQAQSGEGLGTGCVRCRDYPEEYYPRHEPVVETYSTGWVTVPAEPVELVVVEPAPDPAWERVERYASYPVSAEEAEAAIVEAPAEEAFAAAD